MRFQSDNDEISVTVEKDFASVDAILKAIRAVDKNYRPEIVK